MAAKGRKRPARTSPFRRWRKHAAWMLIAFLTLGFGNWFAHQPSEVRAAFGSAESVLEALGAITADWTDALGLTGDDVSIPYLAPIAPQQGPLPFGVPVVANKAKSPDDIVVLKRQGYWVGWSPSLRHPLWSAYAVPVAKLLEMPPPRPPFEADAEAPRSPQPADYTRSGYDRGHLAPNYLIATRYGKSAQKETFLMSNIAPQRPDLNRGPWRGLEQIVADDLSAIGDTLWVITGVVPDTKQRLPKRQGQEPNVAIPAGFYKIVAAVHDNRLRVLSVYMDQEISSAKRTRYCFRSVDAIEAMTGLDFFPALSKERQQALESPEPNRFWPKHALF